MKPAVWTGAGIKARSIPMQFVDFTSISCIMIHLIHHLYWGLIRVREYVSYHFCVMENKLGERKPISWDLWQTLTYGPFNLWVTWSYYLSSNLYASQVAVWLFHLYLCIEATTLTRMLSTTYYFSLLDCLFSNFSKVQWVQSCPYCDHYYIWQQNKKKTSQKYSRKTRN